MKTMKHVVSKKNNSDYCFFFFTFLAEEDLDASSSVFNLKMQSSKHNEDTRKEKEDC